MSEVKYHTRADAFTIVVDDIDIPENVDTVDFTVIYDEIASQTDYDISIELKESEKQFPQVKVLVTNDRFMMFHIRNRMFPCLEKFLYNGCEAEVFINRFNHLENVFFQPKSGILDLYGVYGIMNYAFEGLHACKLINTQDIYIIEEHAFDGSWIEEMSKKQDVVIINNILAYVRDSISELDIPTNVDIMRRKSMPQTVNRVVVHNFATMLQLQELKNIKIHTLKFDDLLRHNITHLVNYTVENFELGTDSDMLTVDGIIYSNDMKTLLACPSNKTGEVIIPEGTEKIGEYAFLHSSIESVIIPDSIKNIGQSAFSDSKIKHVQFGKGLKALSSGIFQRCNGLKHVEIPSNIRKLGSGVFKSSGLETVIFHEGLGCIEQQCFQNTKIKEVSLPESLYHCGNQNFINAEKIYIKKIPQNFLYSLFAARQRLSIAEIYYKEDKYYIGKYYTKNNIKKMCNLMENNINLYKKEQITLCAHSDDKQEIAYRIFKDNGEATDESVMSYLRKVSFNIAERYYQNEMYQELQKLLSSDILSKNGLNKLLKLSTEGNNAVISAYITQAINKEKQNVSFRL